jgi:hypothetical protein
VVTNSSVFWVNTELTHAAPICTRSFLASTLKMEAIRFFKTSVHTRYTWWHIPEDNIFQSFGDFFRLHQQSRCCDSLYTPLLKLQILHSYKGRAIAQAVSRRLPTAAALVQTRVWSCGILWWTKVALGKVFSENFGFPWQPTFHLLLHNHFHYHPRLAQEARSGRSANSLTNLIIIILVQKSTQRFEWTCWFHHIRLF